MSAVLGTTAFTMPISRLSWAADCAASIVQLGGLGPADEAGQKPCAATFRDDVALGGHGGKFCVLGHNSHITKERQIHAVACCGAVDGADNGCICMPHDN